jgi:hypothetical protein
MRRRRGRRQAAARRRQRVKPPLAGVPMAVHDARFPFHGSEGDDA